jgi:hypothetical protein
MALSFLQAGVSPASTWAGERTVPAIAKGLSEHRQRIHSLYVQLRQKRIPGISAKRIGRVWYEQTVAFKGDQLYAYHRYPSDAMDETGKKQGVVEHWSVWNGQVCVARTEVFVSIVSKKKSSDVENNSFFDLLFYPHEADDLGSLNKTDYWLPSALVNYSSEYRVRPQEEVVEDIPCLVIERPGVDTLWLDKARPTLIVRREVTWGKEKPLRERTTNRKFQEMEPGLWLPLEQEQQVFCALELGKETWNQVDYTKRNVISKLEVNKVDDSIFHLMIPPGCAISDKVTGKRYITTNPEEDPWERAFERAQSNHSFTPSFLRTWVLLDLILVGLMAVFVAYRLIPRQPSSGASSSA